MTRDEEATTITPADQDALRRAMDEAKRDPAEAKHLAHLLEDRDWTDVAQSAAYHCQTRNLKLKPWESPPMFGDVDNPRGGGERVRARELLDKLWPPGKSVI